MTDKPSKKKIKERRLDYLLKLIFCMKAIQFNRCKTQACDLKYLFLIGYEKSNGKGYN